MNREQIMKAAAKAKKPTFRKWWSKNGYKVTRVILFPLWIYTIIRDKVRDRTYKELTYSDEMCKRYLDKEIARLIIRHKCSEEIVITNDEYYGDFQISDLTYWCRSKSKKTKQFLSKFSRQVEDFLLNRYTIDGYEKVTALNWSDWQDLKKGLNWDYAPYGDHTKGIVFFSENA